MVWRSGLAAGRYQAFAFIPRNYATTRSADYKIESFAGANYTVHNELHINQYNYSDVWVDLGTYNFTNEPAAFLGDASGESYNTKRMVGFDAVKFVRINPVPAPTPTPTPVPPPAPVPVPGVSINVPYFCQSDMPWAISVMKPSSKLMGKWGCLATSVAAVACWGGVSTDPGKYCDWLSKNNGFTSDGDYTNTGLIEKYTGNKVTNTGWNDWTNVPADVNKVKGELDQKHPVILEVRLFGGQHFVVAVGYKMSGSQVSDLTIMDPYRSATQLYSFKDYYLFGSTFAKRIYGAKYFNHR